MSGQGLTVYFSSVTGNMEMKKNQQKIFMILEGKKYQFEKVDISTASELKDRMRQIANDSSALPPQIANGECYCGNYEAFEEAVECETLAEFLKI